MTDNNSSDNRSEKRKPFAELGRLLSAHLGWEYDSKDSGVKDNPPPPHEKFKILVFLKPVPWILTGFFILSFFWDFHEVEVTLLGLILPFEGLIRIISISGLIGFLTNWIAITMLFRPLQKRPLLGQGLIPAHKERIATRLATAVSEDLINPGLIKKKIGHSKIISRYRKLVIHHLSRVTRRKEFREDLKQWILLYIAELAQNTEFKNAVAKHAAKEIEEAVEDKIIEKAALKTYAYLRGRPMNDIIEEALARLPYSAEQNIHYVEKFLDDLPDQIGKQGTKIDEVVTIVLYRLINRLDVHTLVEENLREYDEQKLENMIRNATNEQLKTIQYLGAILGTIGGFVIWQPLLSISVLGVLLGSVFLTDWVLYKYKTA